MNGRLKPKTTIIIKHFINPLNLKQVDEFYVVFADGKTYTIPKTLRDLILPHKSVHEARHIKALPTKPTLVKATTRTPYVRQQHFKPKEPNDIRKNLSQIAPDDPERFKKVVNELNSLPEHVDPKDFKDIIETFYAHIYSAPQSSIDLSQLDTTKKINGRYLFDYLMEAKPFMFETCHAKLAMALPEENLPKDLDKRTRSNLITYYGYRSKMLPDDQRNRYLDSKFQDLYTPDLMLHLFTKAMNSPSLEEMDEFDFYDDNIRNFLTGVDYFAQSSDVDFANMVNTLKKYISGAKYPGVLINNLADLLMYATGVSRNPKRLTKLLKKHGLAVDEFYTEDEGGDTESTARQMIDDWSYSSNTKPFSVLMRRSYAAHFGIHRPRSAFQDTYSVYTHYHISELTKDKIPKFIADGLDLMRKATNHAIKELDVPDYLYRGLHLEKLDDVDFHIDPSLSSTTADESVAADFAHTFSHRRIPYKDVRYAENDGVYLHPSVRKYTVGYYRAREGVILKLDAHKLHKDGRIIHILDHRYQEAMEDYGISSRDDFDESEFIVGF